jgi:hypothetical protein
MSPAGSKHNTNDGSETCGAAVRKARKQMGRNGAASPKGWLATGEGPSVRTLLRPRWPLGVRGIALAATVLALLGVVAFAVTHEATMTGRTLGPTLSRPAARPPKPPFTRAEEAYIQALWLVHAEVERSTVRVSLGKILYKTGELGKPELRARLDAALANYQQAEERIQALQPPPSLQRDHDEYLAAVRLFQQSAFETLEMFNDGNDDHLFAAYPLSKEGSDKIREIGVKFWQDEFPAN